jgi:hypothetical protein
MIKCLATGCALILDAYDPSKYYWGDMHVVNGAYIFVASGPVGRPTTNGIEQLSGERPIFHVASYQNFLTWGSIYILEDGTPNDAFLVRSQHYLRKVYGVAFSAQERVIAPFYTEQAAINASRDWGANGVITLDSPLTFEKELASIRHSRLAIRATQSGRIASSYKVEPHQLPGSEQKQLASLAAVLGTAIGAPGGPGAPVEPNVPPWEGAGAGAGAGAHIIRLNDKEILE